MVQMNWFAGQKLRHRCREQTYGHQGGKAAGGGLGGVMNWAIGIDMYTLMCIKLMTNKNLLYKKINKIQKFKKKTKTKKTQSKKKTKQLSKFIKAENRIEDEGTGPMLPLGIYLEDRNCSIKVL